MNITVTRVLITDRYAVIREGLRRLFEATHDVVVTAEAATGAEALGRARGDVDCLVTELHLTDRDGLELLRLFSDHRPGLPVIIFTSSDDDELALRCLRGGAWAFVGKDEPLHSLVDAVRSVARGRKYLTASMAARLATEVGAPLGAHRQVELSQREYQVMQGIVGGISLTELGRKLGLSPKTVSTYRERVLKKLRLKTNAELIRYSLGHTARPRTQERCQVRPRGDHGNHGSH